MARNLPSDKRETSKLAELAATTLANMKLIEGRLSRHAAARELAERLVDRLIADAGEARLTAASDGLGQNCHRAKRRPRELAPLL